MVRSESGSHLEPLTLDAVTGLVVIGGNGSPTGALHLSDRPRRRDGRSG